jgi:FkbM family methyltransferase
MSTRRFDLVEVVVIGFSIAVATFAVNQAATAVPGHDTRMLGLMGASELVPLRERYGPTHLSENAEEWIIRDFFRDRRDGIFLDVGAHHYRDNSNTYFLETSLGWRGIAIDAQAEFAADYAKHRPRTTFLARFVSDVSDSTALLHVPSANTLVASASAEFAEGSANDHAESRSVPTVTLDDVLSDAGIERLDFLSMDIELSEPKALAGFDITRYRPELVCIEAHVQVRQAILDYFFRHDYVLVGRYLRIDPLNLFFMPAERPGDGAATD